MPEQQQSTGEVIHYPTEDARTRVECRYAGDTVWRTQAFMVGGDGKDVRTANDHNQNLLEEGEIDPTAIIRKLRIVRPEGKRKRPDPEKRRP